MFWNQYPYINLNDLNLDFLLKAIGEMQNEVKNFVTLNAVKYADPIQWDITSQYEKNTIVIDPLTGTAYISVQPVPSGVALNRTEYWTPVFDLSLFITQGNANLTEHVEGAGVVYSTFALNAGDWVIWNGILYKALVTMPIGTAYSVDGNIKRVTVEEYIKDILTAIANEVQARIDADDAINNTIGDLNDLTTTAKNNLVAAINEVDGDLDALIAHNKVINVLDYGAKGDGIADDTTAFTNAMTDVNTTGGVLWIPQGSYILNAPIVITHHGVHIVGASKNGTYLFIDSDVNAIECVGTNDADISSPSVENLSIENRSGASTKSAIYFEYTTNCVIDRIITNDFAIGINLSHSGNGKVTNVFTVSSLSNAIGYMHRNRSVSTVYYNISCAFTGNAISNGFGFLANEGNVADINVNYFDCANGAYGMVFDGTNAPAGSSLSDINLYDIICDGQRTAGLRIANGSELSSVNVVGGWFNESINMTPNAVCIDIFNAENISITNCNCQQMSNTAPSVRGIVANGAKNCNFVGNKFINCLSAIQCTNGSDNIIADNNVSIYGATVVNEIAILLYDGIISGNNIAGYYAFGIIGRGEDCIITNNRVKNCTTGITNSATVNAITDNNI